MPKLKNPLWEKFCQLRARGVGQAKAYEQAGFKGKNTKSLAANASSLGQRKQIKIRVREIHEARLKASLASNETRRVWIDGQMNMLYGRCIQATPVKGKNGELLGQWTFDAKHAVRILELLGHEQGMFTKKLDVSHRRVDMIEGSVEQIQERIALLLEKMGREACIAIMKRIGYEIVPANLRVIEGVAEDVGDAGSPAT